MRSKSTKIIIAAFSGILMAFLLLIAVDYYLPGRKPAPQALQAGSVSAMAEKLLAEAMMRPVAPDEALPSYRPGLSTGSVSAGGAIMLVKNDEFKGVIEAPKGMMDILSDMAGSGKKKSTPVKLGKKALEKQIFIQSRPADPSAGSYTVPELGKGPDEKMGGLSMIQAPVGFKIFKTSETWTAFAAAHKGRFPEADFSKEQMVILVSLSELPCGIFKIDRVERKQDGILVRYRVDPLAMSAESETKEYEFYSAAVMPRTALPVKLEQVP